MVRDDNRGGTWYPPAGALERGEDLIGGANRIVQTACGCTPDFGGIVSITHMPLLPGRNVSHLRFVLEGQLSVEALSEMTALAPASYLLPAEIRGLTLRDDAIADVIESHARGRASAPMDLYRVGLD